MKAHTQRVLLDIDSIDAICLAEMGMSNAVIRDYTGICHRTGAPLSDGQIHYRLTKAKVIAGYGKGDGFRKAWREGRSDLARDFRRSALPALRKEYNLHIAPQVQKLPAQVITQARFERKERARAARYERVSRAA